MLHVDTALLKKYAVPGPRYTSYPPAPVFSDAFGWQEYLHAVETSNDLRRPLSLYVHLPFCRSLCWYCGCNRLITHHRAKITAYLEYVQREIGLLSTHLSGDRVVVQLHWGGGSPSYLSQAEKLTLMRGLRQHFEITAEAEMGIELDPRDLRPGDAEALRAAGFNRVSFGVQDFHPDVQQAVHRVHPEERILEVFAQLRQAGFASINVDLMYGLPRQSLVTFTDTIAKTIRMRPDRIALFNFAYLPALFKHQRLLNAADLPAPDEKLRMLKMAIETLTAHGYVYIGMDHFARPEDDLCRAQRHHTLYRNFQGYSTRAGCDLLAFGSSAIGQVADVYAQNHKALRAYYGAIDAGIPATARGYHLRRDDQIRRHVIQQLMCHLVLEKASVEAQWQIDFDGYFTAELEALRPLEAVVPGAVYSQGRRRRKHRGLYPASPGGRVSGLCHQPVRRRRLRWRLSAFVGAVGVSETPYPGTAVWQPAGGGASGWTGPQAAPGQHRRAPQGHRQDLQLQAWHRRLARRHRRAAWATGGARLRHRLSRQRAVRLYGNLPGAAWPGAGTRSVPGAGRTGISDIPHMVRLFSEMR
jgi:oxygen-independent coproporphyrinogen-3 oxidase